MFIGVIRLVVAYSIIQLAGFGERAGCIFMTYGLVIPTGLFSCTEVIF